MSRVGLAEVVVKHGVPVGVTRRGVVLQPEMQWEHGLRHGGVEDPLVPTTVEGLGTHIMTYVAFGPLGPRIAVATSGDLVSRQRLGPVLFGYEPSLDVDLNLYPNKDALFFPEPVPDPAGEPCYAMLHRPMWRGLFGLADDLPPPSGDRRAARDLDLLRPGGSGRCRPECAHHNARPTAASPSAEFPFESAKIGGGPPPIRVPEGWLLIHHGVAGDIDAGFDPTARSSAIYRAGAMLLDPDDPAQVLDRTV